MKLYPVLRYQDSHAAYRWLQDAFGLEPVCIYENQEGEVAHAELRWGDDLIMFGPAGNDEQRAQLGLGAVYVSCSDPDALCARATAARARVLMELTEQEYGSRDFAVADPEGNRWSFGTYEPR